MHSKYKYLVTKVLWLFFFCNFLGFIYDVTGVNKEHAKPVLKVTQLCLNVSRVVKLRYVGAAQQKQLMAEQTLYLWMFFAPDFVKTIGMVWKWLDHWIIVLAHLNTQQMTTVKSHIILRRHAPVIDIKTDIDADKRTAANGPTLLNYRYSISIVPAIAELWTWILRSQLLTWRLIAIFTPAGLSVVCWTHNWNVIRLSTALEDI